MHNFSWISNIMQKFRKKVMNQSKEKTSGQKDKQTDSNSLEYMAEGQIKSINTNLVFMKRPLLSYI